MEIIIASMNFCFVIKEHVHKGSGRRDLEDCNVHIESDSLARVSPTHRYGPYYTSNLKVCGGIGKK